MQLAADGGRLGRWTRAWQREYQLPEDDHGTVVRPVPRLGRCRRPRCGDGGPHRRGIRSSRPTSTQIQILCTVRRQTTPGPGGLIDKGTKGKRARTVPLIEEVRPMVASRLLTARSPDNRLFTGPKGGRISTAVLRDATQWDEVVRSSGTSIWSATTCDTPASRGWPTPGFRFMSSARSLVMGHSQRRSAISTLTGARSRRRARR